MCSVFDGASFQDSKGWDGVGTGLNASNASTLSEEAQETTALELWGDCPAVPCRRQRGGAAGCTAGRLCLHFLSRPERSFESFESFESFK